MWLFNIRVSSKELNLCAVSLTQQINRQHDAPKQQTTMNENAKRRERMKRHIIPAIAAASVLLWQSQSTIAADPPKIIVIVPEAEVVSKSTQVQRFNINLPVARDQVAMPLTLRLTNGGNSGQKFAWARLFLNPGMSPSTQINPAPSGRMVVTERSFANNNELVLDLTGQLSAGNNVLMFQGAGMPGASFGYELKSQEVKGVRVSSVDPPEVPPGGNLTINGTGFDEASDKDKVSIYNKSCVVLSSTTSKLEIKTPSGLPPHAYTVDVTVNGVKSNAVSFNVTPTPELGSSSVASMAPGSTFEFSGKHFSKIPSKNVVKITVNGMASKTASVTSCSENSITIAVPQFPDLNINQTNTNADLSVEVDGVPVQGTMWVSIGYRTMAR
jgi:hypothetical protein